MLSDIDYDEILGPIAHMPWSKSNEIWTVFYRTTVAGHWSKDDVDEFASCSCFYEIHLQHGNDDAANMMCLQIIRRSKQFMAAKISKLAINDMKVIVLLGKSADMKDKISHIAKEYGFQLARIYGKSSQKTKHDLFYQSKIGEYIDSLMKAFAPMASSRARTFGKPINRNTAGQ